MRTLSLYTYFLALFIHHTVTPKSGLPGERFPDPSNAAGSSPYLDKVKVSAKNKTNKKLKVSSIIFTVEVFLFDIRQAFSFCDKRIFPFTTVFLNTYAIKTHSGII